MRMRKLCARKSASRKRIGRCRKSGQKFENLGTINPNAIEEYGRVFERFTDLSMQKEDLEKAEADLQKVIAEIVSGMRRTFREKFELISRNFQEIFQVLFGGGRAKLALEEGILWNAA